MYPQAGNGNSLIIVGVTDRSAENYTPLEAEGGIVDRTYRCLDCLEGTVTRRFDTAHLSTMCSECDSFERFINETVFDQFQAFEKSPPESLQWPRLDRSEKLIISEQVVRKGRSIEDFSIEA